MQEPAHTIHRLIQRAYDGRFARSGLLAWMQVSSTRAEHDSLRRVKDLHYYLGLVAVHL
ncbi:hypothetical protein [Burkholderia stabilis]|uniref:hypothetical protein n=1 Tax=Burkholderia stabilis TaxID=95485 RepID=UPI0032087C73